MNSLKLQFFLFLLSQLLPRFPIQFLVHFWLHKTGVVATPSHLRQPAKSKRRREGCKLMHAICRDGDTDVNTPQKDVLDSRGISTFLSFNASLPQRCQRHKSTTRPTVLLQNRQATPTPKGTGRNGRPGPPPDPLTSPPPAPKGPQG